MLEKKILIVDDEKSACDSLGGVFERRGYSVSIANGGKDALAIIKNTFFPVVLLDLKMPDLYGTEVLKEAIKIHPTSKIIMITGFGGEDSDEKECLAMGAYAYIAKPINLKKVYEMVNNIISNS